MKSLLRSTLAALLITLFGGAPFALEAQAAPTVKTPANGVVNINAASPEQLSLLPGIGPSKAKRIIAYRARRKFKKTYEIIRVKGIGRRTFRKLKPFLRVSGPTTMAPKSAGKKKRS